MSTVSLLLLSLFVEPPYGLRPMYGQEVLGARASVNRDRFTVEEFVTSQKLSEGRFVESLTSGDGSIAIMSITKLPEVEPGELLDRLASDALTFSSHTQSFNPILKNVGRICGISADAKMIVAGSATDGLQLIYLPNLHRRLLSKNEIVSFTPYGPVIVRNGRVASVHWSENDSDFRESKCNAKVSGNTLAIGCYTIPLKTFENLVPVVSKHGIAYFDGSVRIESPKGKWQIKTIYYLLKGWWIDDDELLLKRKADYWSHVRLKGTGIVETRIKVPEGHMLLRRAARLGWANRHTIHSTTKGAFSSRNQAHGDPFSGGVGALCNIQH